MRWIKGVLVSTVAATTLAMAGCVSTTTYEPNRTTVDRSHPWKVWRDPEAFNAVQRRVPVEWRGRSRLVLDATRRRTGGSGNRPQRATPP